MMAMGITYMYKGNIQPLSCWTRIYPAFANGVDSDQLAFEEANWSGSALFAFVYEYLSTVWIK